MGLRGMIPCRRSDDDGAIRDAAEDALGQRSERSFQGPARPDRRHGSSAGEAGRNDRLAVLEERFGAVYWYKPGQPPLPTRLMAGLSILKHTHNLSDEELCARWIENPCYQLFCGEELFVHKLPFDRSSLTRWRQRMGEEKLVALIQESLNTATRTGRRQAFGLCEGHRRLDRAAEGGGVSDRREAHAPGARAPGAARPQARRALAPVLRAGGEKGVDDLPALRSRQAVQARQPGAAQRTHLSRPGVARHRA